MTDLIGIMIVLFIIIGGAAIIVAYRPIWIRLKDCCRNRRKQTAEKIVGENLKILCGKNKASTKAGAFIALMQVSYVLVHTMINKGNHYDDEKQRKDFCNSLTPQLLERLNSMEGKYE